MNGLFFFKRFLTAILLLIALAGNNIAFAGDIFDAVQKDNMEKIKALLKDNPDIINRKDGFAGGTPLRWAAFYGHKDVVELLLTNKADVNAKEFVGGTPLMCAASTGHSDVVELLLANKANIDERDNIGLTALHYANSADVSEMLLTNNAEVDAKDKFGNSPLHYAARFGRKDVAEELLANKADVNSTNNIGDTPLHDMARGDYDYMVKANGYIETAELLLTNKAEINAKNTNGETPLHLAEIKGHTNVVELLRQHGGHE
jgi:ankyrin repeat protein